MNYITGLGEILFDCLPQGKKLGGAPANFAFHASQQGLCGIAVSAIGRDDNGKEIKAILDGTPSLQYHLEEVDFPTGTVQVTLDERGIPQYDICTAVAYDNIPWTPAIERIARHTRAVCWGTLAQRNAVSRDTVGRFLDAMPGEGTFRVFDINLRQQWYSQEVVEESLQRCNVLKLNDEELPVVEKLLGVGTVQDIRCRYGVDIVILTCGDKGSHVYHEGGVSSLDTPWVKVVDTVGAGDAFTGAFVAGLLQGNSVAEAHDKAVRVAAYVCTQPGAMPQVPPQL